MRPRAFCHCIVRAEGMADMISAYVIALDAC